MKPRCVALASFIALSSFVSGASVRALPPPEEVPEEILRAEIILEGRSPIDGEPLTAAEYAELQAALTEAEFSPTLSSDVRYIIFILQVRRMLRTLLPPSRLILN
ncbi:MAG: hypothetical protein VKL39_12330 [Leptolyngbyaceae bacterium]|nr:hypothetical protein [Leptolyngbyaceae bacterium]